MNQRFPKKEKLKNKKLIGLLFEKGSSISAYPLRLVYLKTTLNTGVCLQVTVSVSKRNLKKAVDRNRTKRLLREAYRLNKPRFFNNLTTQYAFMFLYIGKDLPKFKEVNTQTQQLFKTFLKNNRQR